MKHPRKLGVTFQTDGPWLVLWRVSEWGYPGSDALCLLGPVPLLVALLLLDTHLRPQLLTAGVPKTC